jgi:hypothetical protein
MLTPRTCWLAVLLLAFLFPCPAEAQTVTIYPSKDASLFDPECEKASGSGDFLFSGNTDGQGIRRALMYFDINGSIPAGVVIQSVSLTLHVSMSNTGTQTFTLHRLTNDWGEGASDSGDPGGGGDSALDNDVTWCYRFYNKDNPSASPSWSPHGGEYDGASSANQNVGGLGFYTWTSAQMATDVQNWLDTPSSNFGYILIGNEGQNKTAKRYDSREHPTASLRPALVVQYGVPATPPDVTVIVPNGGETVTGNTGTVVQWSSSDESGIASHDLYVSFDDGVTFDAIVTGLPDTSQYTWFPANRPTAQAWFRVVATDNTAVPNSDDSDAAFTIQAPPGGIVATTLRDFDQPGTQPLTGEKLKDPGNCATCHGGYGQQDVEPYYNWQGSMMANASLDPLFEAALVIANQDAPDSGDLCLRCHNSKGWLNGRSIPTGGDQMLDEDKIGVSCNLCHRMVDPIPDAENPDEDTAILAALDEVPAHFGTGMYVVDPDAAARRGPFVDATSGHAILVSPFHREAAFCGTCHNVSNPAFSRDVDGSFVPNALDTPAPSFSPDSIMAVERTYSEWFFSEYNTPGGVYAPQFGGNKDFVGSCQDCHMQDVTGQACNNVAAPVRTDLPLHDMTGGSTWLPGLLSFLHPGKVNDLAIQDGIIRARYMLQNAADLSLVSVDSMLTVRVTNNTGHKLPTGYPEGRRMWLNVRFYDGSMAQVGESAAYDASTGVLSHDPEAKIYEIEPATDGIPGVPDSTLFHFVLNNTVIKDNRIPPRGFTNAAYEAFGGPPVAYTYADSQYWDDTRYLIPPGAVTAEVTLYYQSASKEFVEFLRDENTTNTKGQEMYDLWNNNGKCPPEMMDTLTIDLTPTVAGGPGIQRTGLSQNYPNPFNPGTTIRYTVGESGRVSLRVYDVAGRLVRVLVDRDQKASADVFDVTWDGNNDSGESVSSGVYFYRLEVNNYRETRKMILLR